MDQNRQTLAQLTSVGWKQFLNAKQEMLYKYELAKVYSKTRSVQTAHGNVAEAAFRNWLEDFLPKQFGVTSGYIVSQRNYGVRTLDHYDVIVYDQLNSPLLWTERDDDRSDQGRIRAVPAEYVHAIFEVKSSLDTRNASEAIGKLEQVEPLLAGLDEPGERYPRYVSANFCMATIFFELRKADEFDVEALVKLIPAKPLRGYCGSLILKGEGLDVDATGRIVLARQEAATDSHLPEGKRSLLSGATLSRTLSGPDNSFLCVFSSWGLHHFSEFAFDLLAMIRGTYKHGYVSSFHGLPLPTS